MTAMVGMIDPPRLESLDAVRSAQNANIRVRMVTGDDVVTGAAVAEQLGIPGEAILGTDLAAMSEAERLARIDDIGVVGRVAPEHKVLMVETLRKKGEVVAMTGDGVNDAPGDQGRRHRHRHGLRNPGREERRPDDPHRRQLRHDRAGRVRGPQALRQHAQVHPVHAGGAGHLCGDLPVGEPAQHRRRAALLRRPDPVDQLPDHRAGRHRAGSGQGDSRADEAPCRDRARRRS